MQKLNLKINGLYTHPNDLSEVPSGALVVADNIVIDKESVAQSRRGFQVASAEVTNPRKLFDYQDELLLHAGNDILSYDLGTQTYSTVVAGLISEPLAGRRIQTQEMNNNVYITTASGMLKIDNVAGPGRLAGAPRGLDFVGVVNNAGSFLDDGKDVAYRITFSYVDSNGSLIEGEPSGRVVVENNSGNTAQVDLTINLHQELVVGDKVNIYRSQQSTFDPGDELQLVAELTLDAADITAGSVSFSDNNVDNTLGAFLYTSPTQEGILQSNSRPPIAVDITDFQNRMWFARTKQVQRATVVLKEAFQSGDTFIIDGTNFGDTTIQGTISNINAAGASNVYATLINDRTIVVEGRDLVTAAFTVSSNRLSADVVSTNDEFKNRVYFSKFQQPEAVPVTNFLNIGDEDKAIIRILSIEEILFVLKEDGVFRITGTDETNFFVEQHDNTIRMVGPETAVRFANKVICMSNKGVVAISRGGVAIISRQIEEDLLELTLREGFEQTAFGVSYDSDRKYLISVPQSDNDPIASQIFVFNTQTNSWTRWPISAFAGHVKFRDDELFYMRYINDTTGELIRERKSRTLDDYADDEFPANIDSISGTSIVLSDATSAIPGYSIRQGSVIAVIKGRDLINNTITIDVDPGFEVGALSIFKPIEVRMQWAKFHGGNPGFLKHLWELTFMFDDARFTEFNFLCSSNLSQSFTSTLVTNTKTTGWGQGSWGAGKWGGGPSGPQAERTYFPKEKTRAHWVNLRMELTQAFTDFSVSGLSVMFAEMYSRFRA